MQASGVGLPLLDLKSLAPGRAQGYPDQDQFQSLLQQRMVSRGWSGGKSSSKSLDQSVLKAQLRQARPASSSSSQASGRTKMIDRFPVSIPKKTNYRKPEGIPWKFMERKDKSLDSEQPSSLTKPGDSSSNSWRPDPRSKALRLSQGTSKTAAAVAQPNSQIEMPPALKKLQDLLNQQPNQTLKVPPNRIPEVEAFLLNAGLPAQQVENLLTSPRFLEQGLSAGDIQSAWQKAVQNTLLEAQASSGLEAQGNNLPTPAPLNPLQNLTSQPEYQRLWENLTLPPQALADLRLELQQLGMPPEALTKLNQENYPQGIPLTQVWQLIQQIPKSGAAAGLDQAKVDAQASPALLSGDKVLEKWRQLLVQAGMDPDLAQTLVSGPTPTNREELQLGLLQMAPPAEPSGQLEAPKPLYLPQSVRFRAIPRLQQSDLVEGDNAAAGKLTKNATIPLQPSQVQPSQAGEAELPGGPEVNKFLASLLAGNRYQEESPAAAPAAADADAPAPAAAASLTPEARDVLWPQVKDAILSHLRSGESQINVDLNPPELGKLHLALNVKGEMVEVTAVPSQPTMAEGAAPGVQQLAQALNQQGLTLSQFQFQNQEGAPVQPVLASFPNPGEQQSDFGQWGSGADGNGAKNFPFASQTQGVNLSGAADLNNFLALLNGGTPLNGDLPGAAGVPGEGSQGVHALLTPEARESLWSQVQTGVLGHLRPGENQVTLTLSPPEMGKLHLTLNLKGETVQVTAVASHQAVAEAGAAGMQQLAEALNQQGLTLTQFQFQHQDEAAKGQTQYAFSQNSGEQRQAGSKEDTDQREQPAPRQRRGNRGIDCFA
jgi:flagellar hook-length control protein FliK